MVHPLVEDDQRTLDRIQVRDRVLGEHGKTVGINQLRDAVVDLSVDMVRASCEHDAMSSGLLQIL